MNTCDTTNSWFQIRYGNLPTTLDNAWSLWRSAFLALEAHEPLEKGPAEQVDHAMNAVDAAHNAYDRFRYLPNGGPCLENPGRCLS